MRGLRTAIITLLVVMSLIGPSPALAQDDDRPVDLAAMTLRPTDLDAEGYANHGLSNSIMTDDPAAFADFFAFWRGDDAGDVMADALDAADPQRAYALQLIETGQPGDIDSGVESRVVSYVIAFADGDSAEDGFAVLAEAWASDGMEEVDTNANVGDERTLVEGSASERAGSRYQRSDLLFRVDHLVTGVSVEVYDATPPETMTVEALAERQANYVESVLDDGGPQLSHQVLRLAVPGRNAVFDMYTIVDEERFYRIEETTQESRERQAEAEEDGIIDQYQTQQQVTGDALDPSAGLPAFVSSRVVRFTDDDAAAAYLQDSVDRLVDGGAEDLEAVEELPSLGDEVAAYTYSHTRADGQVFNDYRIYVRIGADFFTIGLNTSNDVDLDAVNELAVLQAECLAGDASCLEPAQVPPSL